MRLALCLFAALVCLAQQTSPTSHAPAALNSSADITSQAKIVNTTSVTKASKHYDPHTLMACVVIVVIFALLFDFSNGFHDTANSIATCVGTRSMYVPFIISYLPFCKSAAVNGEGKEFIRSALTALFAGIFNFLPVFVTELHVANQISSVIDTKHFPDGTFVPLGILCTYSTLISALFWNFLTWQFGIPSSSSHALIGSLVGSGLAVSGIAGVTWSKVVSIIYGLLGSPVYAGIMAFVTFILCLAVFKSWARCLGYEVDRNNHFFRALEILSTGGLAWLHGSNDAQKTMGVIAACLLSAGYTTTHTYHDSTGKSVTDVTIQPWVMFACNSAIGIGTLFGGWSIVGKMALDVYPKMNRASGFSANSGAIISLAVATYGLPIGLPVSTTHAMNCGILAAGVTEGGFKAVQWRVMLNMVITWIITIPITIFLGFALASLMLLPGAWSPFFCIFWGVAIIIFMLACVYKQRHTRKEMSKRVSQKYELQSTPSSNFKPTLKGKDERDFVASDPAALNLINISSASSAADPEVDREQQVTFRVKDDP